MELKDKIAITAAIVTASAFGVGVLTFLFGPGITKAAIAVDYTVEDNISSRLLQIPLISILILQILYLIKDWKMLVCI